MFLHVRHSPDRSFATLALWIFLLAALLPAVARAQTVRPWTPPEADSVLAWAAEARARFRTQAGDSVGGADYRAYELVGLSARRLLRSLGPGNMAQAPAVEAALDSLGLEVAVALDPAAATFALVTVRNPFRHTADAVAFLYWQRAEDLRMQGAVLRGGLDPRIRVWWTGRREYPYEWAVVDRDTDHSLRFSLFRLSPGGTRWGLQQDEEVSPVLGSPGEAAFVDLNRDGRPELVSWSPGSTDSLFVECASCPRLLLERTYTEGNEGFELHDTRVVPSPYATFVLFVRYLLDGRRDQASRLLSRPERLEAAVAAGFGSKRAPGTWQVEYGEPDQPWPRWLAMRFDGPQGVKRYIVHFATREGHWLIHDWVEPKRAPTGVPVVVPGSKRP